MNHPIDDRTAALSPTRRAVLTVIAAFVTLLGTVAATPVAHAGVGGPPIPKEFVVERQLNANKCAEAADKAGWRGDDLVIATAVSLAESGCDPKATNTNGPTSGCSSGSTDRGAWQINDCYHGEVSDTCSFKLQCNANAAHDIWADAGSSFQPWTTYNTRVFKYYLNEARRAVKHVTGENIVVGVVETTGGSLNIREKPTSKSDMVGTLPNQAVIEIVCQTRGERVSSPVFGGSTRVWDSLGPDRFVSDAYVYTDSDKRVAEDC